MGTRRMCAPIPSASSRSMSRQVRTWSRSSTAYTPISLRAWSWRSPPRSSGPSSRYEGDSAAMPDRRSAFRTLREIGAVMLVLVTVIAVGSVLTVWTGFPKGTDAYAHLTRLQFLAQFFPRHEWLYSWSAGMPAFETYPELPYLLAAPVTKIFGAPAALVAIAFVGMSLLGLGLYGTVRTATGSTIGGLVAALAAIGSMATWTWLVNGGAYARVFAPGRP